MVDNRYCIDVSTRTWAIDNLSRFVWAFDIHHVPESFSVTHYDENDIQINPNFRHSIKKIRFVINCSDVFLRKLTTNEGPCYLALKDHINKYVGSDKTKHNVYAKLCGDHHPWNHISKWNFTGAKRITCLQATTLVEKYGFASTEVDQFNKFEYAAKVMNEAFKKSVCKFTPDVNLIKYKSHPIFQEAFLEYKKYLAMKNNIILLLEDVRDEQILLLLEEVKQKFADWFKYCPDNIDEIVSKWFESIRHCALMSFCLSRNTKFPIDIKAKGLESIKVFKSLMKPFAEGPDIIITEASEIETVKFSDNHFKYDYNFRFVFKDYNSQKYEINKVEYAEKVMNEALSKAVCKYTPDIDLLRYKNHPAFQNTIPKYTRYLSNTDNLICSISTDDEIRDDNLILLLKETKKDFVDWFKHCPSNIDEIVFKRWCAIKHCAFIAICKFKNIKLPIDLKMKGLEDIEDFKNIMRPFINGPQIIITDQSENITVDYTNTCFKFDYKFRIHLIDKNQRSVCRNTPEDHLKVTDYNYNYNLIKPFSTVDNLVNTDQYMFLAAQLVNEFKKQNKIKNCEHIKKFKKTLGIRIYKESIDKYKTELIEDFKRSIAIRLKLYPGSYWKNKRGTKYYKKLLGLVQQLSNNDQEVRIKDKSKQKPLKDIPKIKLFKCEPNKRIALSDIKITDGYNFRFKFKPEFIFRLTPPPNDVKKTQFSDKKIYDNYNFRIVFHPKFKYTITSCPYIIYPEMTDNLITDNYKFRFKDKPVFILKVDEPIEVPSFQYTDNFIQPNYYYPFRINLLTKSERLLIEELIKQQNNIKRRMNLNFMIKKAEILRKKQQFVLNELLNNLETCSDNKRHIKIYYIVSMRENYWRILYKVVYKIKSSKVGCLMIFCSTLFKDVFFIPDDSEIKRTFWGFVLSLNSGSLRISKKSYVLKV